MSKSNDFPREAPSREFEFPIDIIGNESGKRRKGDFTFAIPNLKRRAMADKKRAELNGGFEIALNPEVLDLHFMIAYLRFTLVEFPKWWKESDFGYDLDDYSVIKGIYDKCEAYQKEYTEAIWGPQEDLEEDSEDSEEKEAEGDGKQTEEA